MAPEALLFQTGYLTIVDSERRDGRRLYRLGYPNREVRRGLNESLLDALAPSWRTTEDAGALRRLLAAADWPGVEALFRRLLAGIPHDWHRRNEIARYEGYWTSVFYAWFQAALDGVTVEEATSRGRAGPGGAARDGRLRVRVQGGRARGVRRRPGAVAPAATATSTAPRAARST